MKMGISREAQDDYGIESYKRTEEAIVAGVFDQEIVGVEVGGRHRHQTNQTGLGSVKLLVGIKWK